AAGHVCLQSRARRRQGPRHPRSRRRPGDAGGGSAGGHHDGLAPQRAALREAPRDHEGEEKAPGNAGPRRPRSGGAAAPEGGSLRAAPATPERHQGERRRRAPRGVEEKGGARMSTRILIVAEHDGTRLNPSTAKCVACARTIADADITVAVCAANAATVATQAAQLQGVACVLKVENAANEHPLAAVLAPQIVAVAQGYALVLGPSTTFGKDLMPRVAALLDTVQVSDIMAAESATRFRHPIYAGNAIVTVEVESGVQVVGTVRIASFEAAPTDS